jgi:hypothetical protein
VKKVYASNVEMMETMKRILVQFSMLNHSQQAKLLVEAPRAIQWMQQPGAPLPSRKYSIKTGS